MLIIKYHAPLAYSESAPETPLREEAFSRPCRISQYGPMFGISRVMMGTSQCAVFPSEYHSRNAELQISQHAASKLNKAIIGRPSGASISRCNQPIVLYLLPVFRRFTVV